MSAICHLFIITVLLKSVSELLDNYKNSGNVKNIFDQCSEDKIVQAELIFVAVVTKQLVSQQQDTFLPRTLLWSFTHTHTDTLTLRKEGLKSFEFFRLKTGVVWDCVNCLIAAAPCRDVKINTKTCSRHRIENKIKACLYLNIDQTQDSENIQQLKIIKPSSVTRAPLQFQAFKTLNYSIKIQFC